MKTRHGFWEWTDESVAREKARIERALQAGMKILRRELEDDSAAKDDSAPGASRNRN